MSRILTWERDNEGVLHKVVRDELPEDQLPTEADLRAEWRATVTISRTDCCIA